MKNRQVFARTLAVAVALFFGVTVADEIATIRGGTTIPDQPEPIAIPQIVESDIRALRIYPMQPPLIPHDTRGYEVNLQVNKCMSCHGRRRTEDSQAPMISVTHFMDREGNFLAEISPRRYFCNQCHVIQTTARIVVENDFEDMHDLLEALSQREQDD